MNLVWVLVGMNESLLILLSGKYGFGLGEKCLQKVFTDSY